MRTAQRRMTDYLKAVSRRPLKGTGSDGSDLFDRSEKRYGPSYCVEDERRGKCYCKACGAEIDTVQVGEQWQQRNLDGMPHKLTCEG